MLQTKTRTNSKFEQATLKPGTFMSWDDKTYRILAITNARTVEVENLDARTEEILSIDAILFDPNGRQPILASTLQNLRFELNKAFPQQGPAPEVSIPDRLLEKADRVIRIVEEAQEMLKNSVAISIRNNGKEFRWAALQRILEKLGVPSSTFYKYLRLYDEFNGDRAKIALAFRKSTFNKIKQNKVTLCLVDFLIARYYARQDMRLAPSHVYEKILLPLLKRTDRYWVDPDQCPGGVPKDLVEELLDEKIPFEDLFANQEKRQMLSRIKVPSRAWFYAYLRWYQSQPDDPNETFKKRYGDEAFENEFMIFDTFLRNASRPLEMVFADHCLLDVNIVDEETRSQTSRLWLTLLIDAFSRSILGFALLYESPCIESIQTALKSAVWPKDKLLAELQIADKPWACYGIPQKLSLDNAWAHLSHSLETLARNISFKGKYNSIQLEFRPPYKGRYGTLIERVFGNFSKKIRALLPDAIRSGSPKDTRNARREACLLYEDLVKIIVTLIVDYQRTVHSELGGMTPHQKWMEGIQTGLPLVPPMTTTAERMFLRTSPQTRAISTRGVALFGLHYWSPQLSGLERVGIDGKKVRYSFGYDPNDISRIALYRDGAWVGDAAAKELRLQDGSILPISLAEKELAKEIAKARGFDPESWIQFIDDIEEIYQTRREEKEAIQKTGARAKGKPKPGKAKTDASAVEAALAHASLAAVEEDAELTGLLAKFAGRRS